MRVEFLNKIAVSEQFFADELEIRADGNFGLNDSYYYFLESAIENLKWHPSRLYIPEMFLSILLMDKNGNVQITSCQRNDDGFVYVFKNQKWDAKEYPFWLYCNDEYSEKNGEKPYVGDEK